MYFSRLVQDFSGNEFQLEKLEGYEFVCVAGVSRSVRNTEEFRAIRFSADREKHIAFLDPLGDPRIAAKWLNLLSNTSPEPLHPRTDNWIAYFRTSQLLASSRDFVDVVVVEQQPYDPDDVMEFAIFFDGVVQSISDKHFQDNFIRVAAKEIIGFLRVAWNIVLENVFQ